MSHEDLLRRIDKARGARGLEAQQLAAEIDVSPSTMSRMLNGARRITAGDVVALARVLDVSVEYLLGTVEEPARQPLRSDFALAARSNPEVDGADLARLRDRASQIASLDLALGAIIGNPEATRTIAIDKPEGFSSPTPEGEEMARRTREALHLDGPVEDLTSLIEQHFAAYVCREPMGEKLYGALLANHHGLVLMVINSHDSIARQRFTMAHELAHLLFDDAHDEGWVDTHGTARTPAEVRADGFAAELLAPKSDVLALASDQGVSPRRRCTDDQVTALACRVAATFRISYESALYRINRLRLITDDQCAVAKRTNVHEAFAAAGLGATAAELDGPRDVTDPSPTVVDRALTAYASDLVGVGFLGRLWNTEDLGALSAELAAAGWGVD